MPVGKRFEDEDDSASESDEDYTENEKLLLENFRKGDQQYSDEENEILGVGVEESESEDDKSDIALSDVEGQDHDDLPDIRAWGKDKRKFYKTDYVDADYGGFQGKDAQLAEQEEEEARNLQKQLAQQMDDDDFGLKFFAKVPQVEENLAEEVIKTDLSMLSSKQKIQILKKESPELFNLLEDFEVKMTRARDYLAPVLQKYKRGDISNCKAIDFVQTQYELILNYCTNIYMYLLLKASKVNIQNHPVIKRLFQYRQLLLQLEPVYEEIIMPQIELLLKEKKTTGDQNMSSNRRLKLLSTIVQKIQQSNVDKNKEISEKTEKNVKFEKLIEQEVKGLSEKAEIASSSDEDGDDDKKEEDDNPQADADDENEKRPITYQMAKNKGLTPHRKKELRNPRVKHKLKYRKAVIRRKGAVREPRRELSKYCGEISGIKASVSRSIKIKS